ncbi:alpha/beta fold hydrolase [Novosphingobium aquimarinum]|uniref:alpha/beta fold hydrolase n=1 Tax=Novosphingobium aquimarinum TaxID=2682494 RepID=UPI0038CD448C
MLAAPPTGLDFADREILDVLGSQIELFRAGSGPNLLYLHGIDAIEGSAPFIRELAKNFSVIAPSHPGFGASDCPARFDRVDDIAYLYLDMLGLLGIDACVVVGSSFGAWVAAELLTKRPELAQALVLESPLGLPTANRRERNVEDLFMLSRQQFNQIASIEALPPKDMDESQLRREMRRDEALSLFGWTPYMSNPKLAERMHRIACPTLIVWGEDDALIRAGYRKTFAAALPSARVEVVEDAGHCIHTDQSEALAALVREFAGGRAGVEARQEVNGGVA